MKTILKRAAALIIANNNQFQEDEDIDVEVPDDIGNIKLDQNEEMNEGLDGNVGIQNLSETERNTVSKQERFGNLNDENKHSKLQEALLEQKGK